MNLDQWMEHEKKSDAWLAEQVGVSRPFISRIRRNKRSPSLKVAAQLARVTGLPETTFLMDRAA